MSLLAEQIISSASETEHPIIVVGNGPVGIEFVKKTMQLMPDTRILMFGNERWEPYNRVQLSSFFAGQSDLKAITSSQQLRLSPMVDSINHCEIISIDRQKKTVTDSYGYEHYYNKLILATGSHPFIPSIPGINLENIFTFRNLSDIEKLLARRTRSRKTVVIGAGVLGIEAARAMMRENTEVSIIDHLPTVMSNQLDEAAAHILEKHLLSSGIQLYLGCGVKCFSGKEKIEKIILKNDVEIKCDTVILATGIRPTIDLALTAKLSTNRGIRVNDEMQTSDKNIYAIGECAEHRDKIYGLVKPGYEQARVAATNLSGKQSNYTGSVSATRLKIVDVPVFSMGEISEISTKGRERELLYHDKDNNIYRRLILKNRKPIGIVAIGQWQENNRVQEAIQNQRNIWLWNKRRFLKTGCLWPEENSGDVNQWPASAVICHCKGITRGQITASIKTGLSTAAEISQCTGASTVCGSCKPLISQILKSDDVKKADKWSAGLLTLGAITFFSMLLVLLLPAIPYSQTLTSGWQWDELWRNNLYKQISGFSLLGLATVAMIMSLRKRNKKMNFLSFSTWRFIHVVIGFLLIIGLAVHSGYSSGSGLNYLLTLFFISLMLAGGLSSAFIAIEHKLDTVLSMKLRKKIIWMHIIAFWPLPALLTMHIFKSYYF